MPLLNCFISRKKQAAAKLALSASVPGGEADVQPATKHSTYNIPEQQPTPAALAPIDPVTVRQHAIKEAKIRLIGSESDHDAAIAAKELRSCVRVSSYCIPRLCTGAVHGCSASQISSVIQLGARTRLHDVCCAPHLELVLLVRGTAGCGRKHTGSASGAGMHDRGAAHCFSTGIQSAPLQRLSSACGTAAFAGVTSMC